MSHTRQRRDHVDTSVNKLGRNPNRCRWLNANRTMQVDRTVSVRALVTKIHGEVDAGDETDKG